MLLARANYRGKVIRTVPTLVDLAESEIFDFSYLNPEDYLNAVMTYMAFNSNGLISSNGSRQLIEKVNAAGNAFEGGNASLWGEAEVGATPLIPDFGAVAGNALGLTFHFNNTSAETMTGVVDYSFSVTRL